MAGATNAVPEDCPLSHTQFLILCALAAGDSYQQIAADLNLTASGVRSATREARCRLGVASTPEAVTFAGRRGWLDWEPPIDPATPLAAKHPFLAAYVQEFERSRWPNEPDNRAIVGMRLALAGHRNSIRR